MKKAFPLATVLTITDGHLIAPNHMDGVYEILGHMTRDEHLFTHQLPRVSDECLEPLLEQFPFLKDIAVPNGLNSPEKVDEWIAPLIAKHGATLDVEQLGPEEHTHIDPVEEAQMLFPNVKVIAVRLEEDRDEQGE